MDPLSPPPNSIPNSIDGLQEIPFAVLHAFHRYQHFIILGHYKPDADCISSQLAMSIALQKLGKSQQLVSAGPFLRPEIAEFAQQFGDAINQEPLQQFGPENTLAIVLDCSSTSRTKFAQQLDGLRVLVIDHHAAGQSDADLSYCDPTMPSTSMLVYNLLQHLPPFLLQLHPSQYAHLQHGYQAQSGSESAFVDRQIANSLFLGFATDSGFFRFLKPQNAGDMLRIVASLADHQIDLQDIYQQMTGGRATASRRVLGLLLLRAGFLLEGRLCISYGLLEDKQYWQAESGDSDSFYALSLATQDCEAILLLDQAEECQWNIGLRSLKQHDVGAIAAKFGGGGHKNAAGCRTRAETLQGVLSQLLFEVCLLWGVNARSSQEVQDYIQATPQYLTAAVASNLPA